ncbi:MAG: Eco57I restriction-modification methylase domain-containing protein [Sedimentisphaerales bacterium]
MARKISQHTEWLSLIEVSGPFLVVSELERVFPQGLDVVETPRRQRLRAAYEEWCDAVDENDAQLAELHREWIRLVLSDILEYDGDALIPNEKLDEPLSYVSPEHAGSFSPDFIIRGDSDKKPKLIISIQPAGTDLEKVKVGDGWPASLLERMTLLCRQDNIRLGLLTNGQRWMLVNAPVGSTSGNASWYARLWFQEPLTLKAFQSLLGIRRCFGPKEESLEALLEESLKHQEEVTDTLGQQVKRAVEVLVQCLDKADQDRNRELLHDVPPTELYEAGLTVMMRLVFILCAEERGLLLLDEQTYEQYYAVSSLRAQLDEEADRHGSEVLERRHDAWARLLAVFRAVYGGIEHETLRMPALGGSLFDPDRFPFLEGRAKGTSWQDFAAKPLPIDNRTVLLLLNALQILEQRGGALLLSYKALDVEQIGHVYEGLLEHTVARVPEVTLGLEGSQKAKNPNLPLAEMESARIDGIETLVGLIEEATKRSTAAIQNALKKEVDDFLFAKVVAVCGGDMELAKRIRPYANLLRADAWGDFIVYKANSFAVTLGADRRETGTHYTPKSLTESIVSTTLEPVAYIGPAEGTQREEWKLKSSAELLDLKVCDPAMGSGAFLVQACRWLSERVVEAWGNEEKQGKFVTGDGQVLDNLGSEEPMPKSLDDRLIIARRLVAERCLYGVDINLLAVELAKLSIWLVTLAKGRPFGFLDHNLRSGDSLLGIHRLDQLTKLTMNPDDPKIQPRLFGKNIEQAITGAMELRKKLRQIPIRDIRDVEAMTRLDEQARMKLQAVELVADAMIGEVLYSNGNAGNLDIASNTLAGLAQEFLNGNEDIGKAIVKRSRQTLSIDLPAGKPPRWPLHWPLEFPEVFEHGGFDGMIGNPPFMFGKNITVYQGKTYNDFLKYHNQDATNNVDLCAHFFVRAFQLLHMTGCLGFLATRTISEGETKLASLQKICNEAGNIIQAKSKLKWPGKANVYISTVIIFKGKWSGSRLLDGLPKRNISPMLTPEDLYSIKQLLANSDIAFVGVIPNGQGLFLEEEEYNKLVLYNAKNSDVILPYITGKDLNASPNQPKRYIVNFWDWPLSKAEKYPEVLQIVKERVLPHRLTLSEAKKKVKERWWLYEAAAKNLFHALGNSEHFNDCPSKKGGKLERAIAIARISKTGAFTLVPTNAVYAAEVVVYASQSFELFATLQSSLHLSFAWNHAGKMKVDLRYSPTLCFETFPLPDKMMDLKDIGESYYLKRQKILNKLGIGLTEFYHRFHDQNCCDSDIVAFRELAKELDKYVISAYGWQEVNLDHGFHEVDYLPEEDNLRYTICENARCELLSRFARLNAERYAEEVAQGLHDKNKINKNNNHKESDHKELF